MNYFYDPLNAACKSVTGAVSRGSELALNIYRDDGGEEDFSAEVCALVLRRDGGEEREFPMRKTERGFFLCLRFRETGLYFYYFKLRDGRSLGCGKFRKAVQTWEPQTWQITVCDENYRTPAWFKGTVMYQIFPDRFFRAAGEYPVKPYKKLREDWGGTPSFRPNEYGKILNNDFFGGNLEGIRQKLPYLKDLHVGAIYLNPIFEAYSNHRYDTGDYEKIDPLLGTEEDFEMLVSDARALGIAVILDGVFNHTGDDSRYFNKFGRYDSVGAYQSPSSPYIGWYRFREYPDSYESWWGIETLPAVEENSESYQNFICGEKGVVRTWLSRGTGGWRLDVADELPDFFLRKVRAAAKAENPEAIVIGEVWEDASNKIAYDERREYLQGRELDSVMNYPLKDGILNFVRTGNSAQLRETVAMLLDNYPKETLDCLMNVLGTHDTVRAVTVFGEKICTDKEEMARARLPEEEAARAEEKLRMAAVLQYTLPGVPCVYYGDEIGLQGYADPFCRGCFDWSKADCALHAFYRKLGEIRTARFPDVFRDGVYRELYADGGCIVYERRKNNEAVVVAVNNSAGEYAVRTKCAYREQLSGKTTCGDFVIPPFSYGIYAKK